MPKSKEKNKFGLMAVRPYTDEERRKGVRQLAGRAMNPADFAELLAAVDLPAEDGRLPLDQK